MAFNASGTRPASTSDWTGQSAWVGAISLSFLALAIRLIQLDHLPWTDELYTTLAAQGWLAEGVPLVGDGLYERAELYTILVAGFLGQFGDGLVVARVPAVIFGSLLVVAVFLWLRAVADGLAAWIAALFMCFAPIAIQISQFARFYALFGLLFWLGAIAIYASSERRRSWSAIALLALAAGVCLLLSVYLQPLAMLGIAGIALWWVGTVGVPWWWAQRRLPRRFAAIAAVVVLAVAAIVAVGIETGLVARFWVDYRSTPTHNADLRNAVWFYQLNLIERYPSLWPFLPFLALLAIAQAPKPALFCLVVFATAFALLSFGGMKHFRYIYFALPFLFVVWGLALARVGRLLCDLVRRSCIEALRGIHPALANRAVGTTVIAVGVVFLVIANGAPARVLMKPFGLALGSDVDSVEWARARPWLEPWLDNAEVVLTPSDVFALYYLDGYDVAVSTNLLSEIGGGEFDLDPRTGRPVISTPESMRLVMACLPSGVLVTDVFKWRTPKAITDQTADVIQVNTLPIELPEELGIRAFRWQTIESTPSLADCASVRKLVADGRRTRPSVRVRIPAKPGG